MLLLLHMVTSNGAPQIYTYTQRDELLLMLLPHSAEGEWSWCVGECWQCSDNTELCIYTHTSPGFKYSLGLVTMSWKWSYGVFSVSSPPVLLLYTKIPLSGKKKVIGLNDSLQRHQVGRLQTWGIFFLLHYLNIVIICSIDSFHIHQITNCVW